MGGVLLSFNGFFEWMCGIEILLVKTPLSINLPGKLSLEHTTKLYHIYFVQQSVNCRYDEFSTLMGGGNLLHGTFLLTHDD